MDDKPRRNNVYRGLFEDLESSGPKEILGTLNRRGYLRYRGSRGFEKGTLYRTKKIDAIYDSIKKRKDGQKNEIPDTYCHGLSHIALSALRDKEIKSRGRVVIYERDDGTSFHTIVEYHDDSQWKQIDPSKPDREFEPKDYITSHEFYKTSRDPKHAMIALVDDLITMIYGPFYPWKYDRFVGDVQITGENTDNQKIEEIYWRCAEEMAEVIEVGNESELTELIEKLNITLKPSERYEKWKEEKGV